MLFSYMYNNRERTRLENLSLGSLFLETKAFVSSAEGDDDNEYAASSFGKS